MAAASHLKHRSGEKAAGGGGGSEAVNFGANPGENMVAWRKYGGEKPRKCGVAK
jgi:hypothetical protein